MPDARHLNLDTAATDLDALVDLLLDNPGERETIRELLASDLGDDEASRLISLADEEIAAHKAIGVARNDIREYMRLALVNTRRALAAFEELAALRDIDFVEGHNPELFHRAALDAEHNLGTADAVLDRMLFNEESRT